MTSFKVILAVAIVVLIWGTISVTSRHGLSSAQKPLAYADNSQSFDGGAVAVSGNTNAQIIRLHVRPKAPSDQVVSVNPQQLGK